MNSTQGIDIKHLTALRIIGEENLKRRLQFAKNNKYWIQDQ